MILSAQDRFDILELYARYAHLIDTGESDKWAGLFTPDGTFSIRAGAGAPDREFHGTADLAAFCRKHYQQYYGERKLRHGAYNIVVTETENGAEGTAYAMVLLVGNGQPAATRNTGRYVDQLARGAHGWQFRSRTYLSDL